MTYNDYLLTLPLERVKVGTVYKPGISLPLHCTVMTWFKLARGFTLKELEQGLISEITDVFDDINLVSDHAAMFGEARDIPCNVLKQNDALDELHTRVLVYLAGRQSAPENLKWVGAGYRPHVSHVDRSPVRQFAPGSEQKVGEVVLIGRAGDASKHVLSCIELSSLPF